MIVSHSLRYVYIGPPKTGSTSMHLWLKQPGLFDPTCDVDSRNSGGWQHDFLIPKDAKGYFVLATTRNRDVWLDSLWRQSRNDFLDYDDRPLLSWEQFLEWRKNCKDPFYSRELQEYYPDIVDAMLDCDRLSDDVHQLPFWEPTLDMVKPVGWDNRNRRSPMTLAAGKGA